MTVRRIVEADGSLWRLVLSRPKGNVLDRAMVAALRREVAASRTERRLRTLVFEGEGAHFSFGASVEDHRKESVGVMLTEFHDLFHDLVRCDKVLVAAVRGQCLGGGLELAAFCHRVIAAGDANLGCPEVKLGVFAPVGSLVLPWRMGPGAAIDLLLSGRSIVATTAHEQGLVDAIAADPTAAALAWHGESLAPLSATALRFAARAAREGFDHRFLAALDRLERLYLDEVNVTADAGEGIAAFLEKRTPSWTHR